MAKKRKKPKYRKQPGIRRLGSLVHERRKLYGVTMSTLAELSGVCIQTISDLEGCRRYYVESGTCKKLAPHLGVSWEAMVAIQKGVPNSVALRGRGTAPAPTKPPAPRSKRTVSPSFGLDKLARIEAKMDEAYVEFKKQIIKDLIDEM